MKYYKNKTNSDAILIDAYLNKSSYLLKNLGSYFNFILISFILIQFLVFKHKVEFNYYIIFLIIILTEFFNFLFDYLYKNSPILSFYKYIFYEDKMILKKGLSDKKSVTIKYDDITSVTLSKSLFLRKIEFLIYYKHCGVIKKYTLSNAKKFDEISVFFRNNMLDKFVVI